MYSPNFQYLENQSATLFGENAANFRMYPGKEKDEKVAKLTDSPFWYGDNDKFRDNRN